MTDVIDLDSQLRQLADDLNHALIEQMVSREDLTTPAWRAAFEAVPRHLFAPRFTLPDNLGGHAHDASTATDSAQREDWLRAVYHNDALLTEFDEHDIATTSCSAPSVVATMLESSQASDGGFALIPGGPSNAQSTAWAVQGLLAAGRNPAKVRRGGSRNPMRYLRSLTDGSGEVRYSRTSRQTPVWVTSQSLAALARRALPVGVPR